MRNKLDLNRKIAERRAELQREEAVEDARRRQKALEQEQRRQAQELAIKASAEEAAAQKIQAIEARLHGTREHVSSGPVPVPDERVSQEAEKRVDAHIRKLASKRITKGESLGLGLLFIGCLLGFFLEWWLGLGMLIWTAYYANKVNTRHEAEIRAELAQSKEGSNE